MTSMDHAPEDPPDPASLGVATGRLSVSPHSQLVGSPSQLSPADADGPSLPSSRATDAPERKIGADSRRTAIDPLAHIPGAFPEDK